MWCSAYLDRAGELVGAILTTVDHKAGSLEELLNERDLAILIPMMLSRSFKLLKKRNLRIRSNMGEEEFHQSEERRRE